MWAQTNRQTVTGPTGVEVSTQHHLPNTILSNYTIKQFFLKRHQGARTMTNGTNTVPK